MNNIFYTFEGLKKLNNNNNIYYNTYNIYILHILHVIQVIQVIQGNTRYFSQWKIQQTKQQQYLPILKIR